MEIFEKHRCKKIWTIFGTKTTAWWICTISWNISCRWCRCTIAVPVAERTPVVNGGPVACLALDEGQPLGWWCRSSCRTCPIFTQPCSARSVAFIQWNTFFRWSARKLETYNVHDVTKIAARQAAGWLQAHNECSFALQKICLYDACARGTCIGNSPAWGTTWISQRASGWRTFIDCEFGGG